LFATILRGTCDPRIVPARIEAIGIVICAHNQSSAIAGCIQSIFAACNHSGWRKSLWITVVADACTDATAKAARAALGAFGEVLEIAARCPKTADRIGVSAVMEHFHPMPRDALLLAGMDAGAKLRRDWFELKRPAAEVTKATPREAAESRPVHRPDRRRPRRREQHTEKYSSAVSSS
jgi:hypothetical protein